MHLRAIGRQSTQMNAYFLVMNSKRCIYTNVILERSLRANEGHIGVNESALTIMKQIWAQMNGVFRFSGIFSNLAISLRIRARGKKYLSDIVLECIIFAC